tara:strand:- start:451 stop:582 length:132 start_codon:yes stop_codon:yes gene_type:complete
VHRPSGIEWGDKTNKKEGANINKLNNMNDLKLIAIINLLVKQG